MAEDEMVGCIIHSVAVSLSKLREMVRDGGPGVLQPLGSQSRRRLCD